LHGWCLTRHGWGAKGKETNGKVFVFFAFALFWLAGWGAPAHAGVTQVGRQTVPGLSKN
jgi:hypothetical protein